MLRQIGARIHDFKQGELTWIRGVMEWTHVSRILEGELIREKSSVGHAGVPARRKVENPPKRVLEQPTQMFDESPSARRNATGYFSL